MAEAVSIRIPLSVVLAGTYKVGLTPRDNAPVIADSMAETLRNGGWFLPDGTSHALSNKAHHSNHADLADFLGFGDVNGEYEDSAESALQQGAIRLNTWGDRSYSFEIQNLNNRKELIDIISALPPDRKLYVEWFEPSRKSVDFDNKEEAVDWLENRSVMASKIAVSLPELVEQTNAFSTKNRPGCTAQLQKSSPKDLFLQYKVTCHLPNSDPKGHEVRVEFDTDKIQDSQRANDLDIQCSCSCPAFLYWGAQWNLHQRDGLLGEPRPLLQAPTERLDLRSNFVICKHCKAVFERILPSVQHNINNIIRKKKVEEQTQLRGEQGTKPPTTKRQPGAPEPEQEALTREEEKKLMLEQEGIVERDEPATNAEKEKHPELTETAPKKPRWRETLDRLKERVKGWGGGAVPTPEKKKPEAPEDQDKGVQEALLREEMERLQRPVEKEHTPKPHVDEGLPYEPKWKQLVKKLKDRIKSWGSPKKSSAWRCRHCGSTMIPFEAGGIGCSKCEK
jgi:hypothetical protein